jgi:hypothetical protein
LTTVAIGQTSVVLLFAAQGMSGENNSLPSDNASVAGKLQIKKAIHEI